MLTFLRGVSKLFFKIDPIIHERIIPVSWFKFIDCLGDQRHDFLVRNDFVLREKVGNKNRSNVCFYKNSWHIECKCADRSGCCGANSWKFVKKKRVLWERSIKTVLDIFCSLVECQSAAIVTKSLPGTNNVST